MALKSARNGPNCIPASKAWIAPHPDQVEVGKRQREQQRQGREITAEERAAEQRLFSVDCNSHAVTLPVCEHCHDRYKYTR
jgi:hypothetical protein